MRHIDHRKERLAALPTNFVQSVVVRQAIGMLVVVVALMRCSAWVDKADLLGAALVERDQAATDIALAVSQHPVLSLSGSSH